MDTILMNSKICKISKPYVLILNLTDKIDLRRGEESVAIYYTLESIKSSYSYNKFKTFAPTLKDKFELPDGSYSISDIQNSRLFFKKAWRKYW